MKKVNEMLRRRVPRMRLMRLRRFPYFAQSGPQEKIFSYQYIYLPANECEGAQSMKRTNGKFGYILQSNYWFLRKKTNFLSRKSEI